jgi:hypothetical protein
MPLVLKLIGQFRNNKTYQIRDSYEGTINITVLNNMFLFWGLNQRELENIKFITDSEQIQNPHKNFLVTIDEDRIVHVFSNIPEIKNKLVDVFMREGREVTTGERMFSSEQSNEVQIKHLTQRITPDPEISQPITITEQRTIPKLTKELIDTMNAKSVSMFSDPDFRALISIYIRKPELFGQLAQYVHTGNVVEESLMEQKTVDQLTSEELTNYQNLAEVINGFNLGLSNDIIMEKLIKYSGHINLTLRALLCNIAVSGK